MKTPECVAGILVALTVHPGVVSVLVKTNANPLQPLIVSLLGVGLYLVVLWQYLAGQRTGLWSPVAQKQWRLAGRFFGVLLGLGLLANIAMFHLQKA